MTSTVYQTSGVLKAFALRFATRTPSAAVTRFVRTGCVYLAAEMTTPALTTRLALTNSAEVRVPSNQNISAAGKL